MKSGTSFLKTITLLGQIATILMKTDAILAYTDTNLSEYGINHIGVVIWKWLIGTILPEYGIILSSPTTRFQKSETTFH